MKKQPDNSLKSYSDKLKKCIRKQETELQKAERQLEIEAALGRVRDITMVMKCSEEISEIIIAVYKELRQLDMALTRTLIWLFTENPDTLEVWLTDATADSEYFVMKNEVEHPYHKQMFQKWRERKPRWVYINEGEGKKDLDNYLFTKTAAVAVPEEVKVAIRSVNRIVNSFSFHNFGCLQADGDKELAEENFDILYRFAKEFDLAYTRFLDLQKAESQAREAQIEAALERIRNRSLIMRDSSELNEVVAILFKELNSLNLLPPEARTYFCDINANTHEAKVWMTYTNGEVMTGSHITPLTKSLSMKKYYKAWKEKEPLSVREYKGRDLSTYLNFVSKLSHVKQDKDYQKLFKNPPKKIVMTDANFQQGNIGIMSFNQLSNEALEVLQRFAKVFEFTYTRFLDLKKAEAQARETKIEASLERIRARSMAMHHSDELQDVINLVLKQLQILDFEVDASMIIILNERDKTDTINLWIATSEIDYVQEMHLPYFNHPIITKSFDGFKRKENFYTDLYGKKEARSFMSWMVELPDFKELPENRRRFLLNIDGYARSVALAEYTGIAITNYKPHPFSDEENEILKRIVKVFDQTYTRFLDLQKAENQAREAQIEAALEKVRSRSMAMHRSEELQEVIMLVFKQLRILDVSLDSSMINIRQKGNENFHLWIGNEDATYAQQIEIPLFKHEIHTAYRDSWEKGENILSVVFPKKVKNSYFKYLFEYSDLKHNPEYRKKYIMDADGYSITAAFNKHTELFAVKYRDKPFSNLENEIIIRFGKVFEQSYTRFLDLKKAEEQVREAQIETALERVRAQTMAMQHSDELIKSTKILFEELGKLDLSVERSGIGIFDEETKDCKLWTTVVKPDGKTKLATGITSLTIHPLLIETFNSWKLQKPCQYILEGKELKNYYKLVSSSKFHLPEDVIEKANVLQKEYYLYTPFGAGGLYVFSKEEPSDKEKQILRRFAEVFHLTYTRFEDLQKAETQTREAVKQASLDRVRGEIASMRSKEDLKRITPLVWQELTNLNVSFIRCGVLIMDEENNVVQTHLSTPDGNTLGIFNLPADSEQIAKGAYNSWKEGQIFQEHWNKSKFIRFMQSMIKHGRIDNPESYQGAAAPPESLHLNFLPFKQGMLYVGNTDPLSEEHLELAKSLANALSIAYARYEDFIQLEVANNQIQKALDDLRSTQTQLVHAEKMASLGELTAGIAHEIQNPLNFVNNFSEVSKELIEELKEERAKQVNERDEGFEEEIIDDIIQNLVKINHHGQRASSIVKGMLEHSRSGNREKELTDINNLADEYLRLSYHGLRAKDKSFNADFKAELDPSLPKVKVIGQDLGRVLLNLINNAFYAVSNKSKEGLADYKPEVLLRTKKNDKTIEIVVQDNGGGIPKNVLDKIFQPFFTTKPTGQGTGLGLSLSYDIITKGHDGHLEVDTQEGLGSTFSIQLPIK